MPEEYEQVTFSLSEEEQKEAFEDAVAMIESDVDDGLIDAEQWGESVKSGEIARVLSEAYLGRLEFDGGDASA